MSRPSESGPARPLALAKLAAPALRADAVSRKRLLDRLESAHRCKLVLIQAPAGYGKTTLMVQWSRRLQEGGESIGWVTLDEASNDPSNLLATLIAILLREATTGAPDLLAVINRCASEHLRFTLFLDEAETLREAGSLALLEMLLDYSPANMHVVIGTRAVPALPLARLRVRSEIVDITGEDLRFLRSEAAQFLYVRSGAQLGRDTLDMLLEKTEGWIAALQLITMSLARNAGHDRVVDGLSGSSAQIVEYLAVDVVDRLPADMREFLLQTSILRRLSVPLCEAVTGQPDCGGMLMKLENASLFLHPLDGSRQWYRFHSLFAGFLRERLERQHPGRAREIARKAADWCAGNGQVQEAVEYCLEARDITGAIERMKECMDAQIQAAQFRTILTWLRALPAEELQKHPVLVVANAWALNFCQEYRRAGEALQQLRQLAADQQTEGIFRNALIALEPVLLARAGQFRTMIERGEAAWSQIGRDAPRERSMLANQLAFGYVTVGRHDEAQKCLHEAMACHAETRPANVFGLAHTVGHSAIHDACLGDLKGAIRKLRSIEALVADHAGEVRTWLEPGFLPANTIGLCSELLYELNEVDEAEAWIDKYYRFLDAIPSVETILLAYLTRARVHLSRGETDRADETLDAASRHAVRTGMPRVMVAVEWERARIALLAGDVSRARLIANAFDTPPPPETVPELIVPSDEINGMGIGTIRLLVHEGRCDEALARLDVNIRHATQFLRRRRLVKLRTLEAMALQKAGRPADALRALGAAVRMAATMGAVRSIVDEGLPCQVLMQALAEDPVVKLDRKAAAWVATLLAAFESEDGGAPSRPVSDMKSLVEGLSTREVQILQRLDQGYSNLAVAQQLFVSTNTVKWHLRQVYEKLGAKNRTQAIFLARSHGLLG